MKISEIKISGMFSFGESEVTLLGLSKNNTNYLIGKNNVGKSNVGRSIYSMIKSGYSLDHGSYHKTQSVWSKQASLSMKIETDLDFWGAVCRDVTFYNNRDSDR
jgi:AAA15 family ATPase/GTPase